MAPPTDNKNVVFQVPKYFDRTVRLASDRQRVKKNLSGDSESNSGEIQKHPNLDGPTSGSYEPHKMIHASIKIMPFLSRQAGSKVPMSSAIDLLSQRMSQNSIKRNLFDTEQPA